MNLFLQRFNQFVVGILHGFDRLRFRGSKRQLCHVSGVTSWLRGMGILFKDYTSWSKDTTSTLYRTVERQAEDAGLYRFLNNSRDSKEETALQMAAEQKRTQGLIAVLGCVEPCQVIRVRGNPQTKKLEPRVELSKCKHYYHYYLDPQYGLRYTRLQTWFPFTMHIGLNGRDWLGQQLDQARIAYRKKDNCFPWIADFGAAQQLADQQLTTAWPELLGRWARQSNPLEETLWRCPVPYYWSVDTAEYASDIAFAKAADLAQVYPQLVQHAMTTLQSTDLLRFMGYHVCQNGKPREDFAGEATTRIKELVEGTCVKHHVLENLLKMYDKFGEVLRLENLLRNVRDFKVYRTLENDPDGPMAYRRMRKGVADLHQRAEVSRKINERYAASLATVEETTPLGELTKQMGQRQQWHGRSVRALNPLAAEDVALLEAVSRGEFLISGFRNRDIRAVLYGDAATKNVAEAKRQSGKVTRLLRLLRGHGVIAKIAKTHRYQLTETGRASLSALLAARNANTKQLMQAA
jgi:hypothetical protein